MEGWAHPICLFDTTAAATKARVAKAETPMPTPTACQDNTCACVCVFMVMVLLLRHGEQPRHACRPGTHVEMQEH
jgi:hypothetical protein